MVVGAKAGDAMTGKEAGHGRQRRGRCVHGVAAVTAVDVDVDEAGQHDLAAGVESWRIDH